VCGSRTEAIQKNKITLNSLATVIHKNKRNAAGNSEKVVHPWCRSLFANLLRHTPHFNFQKNRTTHNESLHSYISKILKRVIQLISGAMAFKSGAVGFNLCHSSLF